MKSTVFNGLIRNSKDREGVLARLRAFEQKSPERLKLYKSPEDNPAVIIGETRYWHGEYCFEPLREALSGVKVSNDITLFTISPETEQAYQATLYASSGYLFTVELYTEHE